MNLREQGLQHAVLVDAHVIRRPGRLNAVIQFIVKTLVIAELEARKLRHDPTEIIMRAIQPALWLLVFGEMLSRMHAVPTGSLHSGYEALMKKMLPSKSLDICREARRNFDTSSAVAISAVLYSIPCHDLD